MYLKLTGLYNDISYILEFMKLEEYDFSMLSFSDQPNLHYLVIDDEEGEGAKLLFPERSIIVEEIEVCEMRKLSPMNKENKDRVSKYNFIGNPNLFPFGVTFTDRSGPRF